MKLSQMYRTALIATTMLILSFGLDTKGFAQTNSPQGTKILSWFTAPGRMDPAGPK